MPTAMKLAKTSPALPVLRRKKSRKWVWVSVAVGVLVVAVAAWALLLRGRVSLTGDEKQLVDLMNETRRNNLIAELKPNAALCEVARRHSQKMCDQQRVEFPPVAVLEQELQSVSYPFEGWGMLIDRVENHGPKWTFVSWILRQQTAGEVKSFHHEDVGISVITDQANPDVWYVTVVFGRQKK